MTRITTLLIALLIANVIPPIYLALYFVYGGKSIDAGALAIAHVVLGIIAVLVGLAATDGIDNK